jgi:hypothetical protein
MREDGFQCTKKLFIFIFNHIFNFEFFKIFYKNKQKKEPRISIVPKNVALEQKK